MDTIDGLIGPYDFEDEDEEIDIATGNTPYEHSSRTLRDKPIR
jgi:hypothetical protein